MPTATATATSTATATATVPPAAGARRRNPPTLVTLLRIEVRDELRGIRREPTALFFSVVMPVAFFALFTMLFGAEGGDGAVPAGTAMLATFGAYGVLGAVTVTPGVGLAEGRDRRWIDVVKVSPTPVGVTLAAKVIATLPFSLGILIAMTATAGGLGVLEITATSWFWVVGALILGSLPMSLVGIGVGALASPSATTAVLNAILIPAAIAGGLWFPLELLPDWISTVAVGLPTYHLAQLAGAPLEGGAALPHALYLLAFTGVTALGAAIAYRRSPA